MQTEPFTAIEDPQRRQEAEAIVRACVHCGFCNATCPTYQLLGDERDGPRGRIYLIKQVLEGSPATAKTRLHLDRCLTCRSCETTCPSGVAYGDLIDIGRQVIEQQVGRSWLDAAKRRLLNWVLPYPKRFAFTMGLAWRVKPLLPKSLQQSVPAKPAATNSITAISKYTRTVLLLEGCVQPVLAPEINLALEHILNHFGIGVVCAKTAGCCGALSYHLNFQSQGLSFMRSNIDAWLPHLDAGIDTLVTTASGCGVTVKDYASLLQHDAEYSAKATRISQACVDAVELLEQLNWESVKQSTTPLNTFRPEPVEGRSRTGLDEPIPQQTQHNLAPAINPPKTIAVQSPCTLQHGQKLEGRVEALLSRLGFQLTAVPNAHLCCGSAGTYSLLQPQLAQRLKQDKLSALMASAPDEIATANIGCLQHLRSDAAVPVRHWLEVVAEALDNND